MVSLNYPEPSTGHREGVRAAQARAHARAAQEPQSAPDEPPAPQQPLPMGDHDAAVASALSLFSGATVVYDHERVQDVWFDRTTGKPLKVG